ncbi:HNH endonuclease signature motif containing protein [Streptomyces sp. NPDC051180]|uniref:HNH endonuclease n=1 Tax=Streptomyces sp. NPDC051180 TaxID=3155797 RepID=UPI00344D1BA1
MATFFLAPRVSPRRLPAWVRQAVLSANGGYCTYCGSDGTRAEVVDHVEPLEWGGANTITNLVPACRPCNASKRDRKPLEWRRSLERRHYDLKWWDDPPYPEYVLSYTAEGLLKTIAEVQQEVLELARPHQERAAKRMKRKAAILAEDLLHLTDSQQAELRKEILSLLAG